MEEKRAEVRKDSKVATVSLHFSTFSCPTLAQTQSRSPIVTEPSVSSKIHGTPHTFQFWASQKSGNLILQPLWFGLFGAADSFGVVCYAPNKTNEPCHARRSQLPVLCSSVVRLLCCVFVRKQRQRRTPLTDSPDVHGEGRGKAVFGEWLCRGLCSRWWVSCQEHISHSCAFITK